MIRDLLVVVILMTLSWVVGDAFEWMGVGVILLLSVGCMGSLRILRLLPPVEERKTLGFLIMSVIGVSLGGLVTSGTLPDVLESLTLFLGIGGALYAAHLIFTTERWFPE